MSAFLKRAAAAYVLPLSAVLALGCGPAERPPTPHPAEEQSSLAPDSTKAYILHYLEGAYPATLQAINRDYAGLVTLLESSQVSDPAMSGFESQIQWFFSLGQGVNRVYYIRDTHDPQARTLNLLMRLTYSPERPHGAPLTAEKLFIPNLR